MRKKHVWFYYLVLLTTLIFSVRSVFLNPLINDSYLHLAIGRYIFDHKKIPVHQNLSFKETIPSLELFSHSWLADLFFYLTAKNQIAAGIILILLLALSLLLLNLILKKEGVGFPLRALALATAAVVSPVFWRIHPLVFAPALLLSLFYGRDLTDKKNFLIAPFIFFLFANLCGGFIFLAGSFWLLIVISQVLITFIKKLPLKTLAAPLTVTAAAFLSSTINPFGVKIWLYFINFINIVAVGRKALSSLDGIIKLINQNFLKQSAPRLLFAVYALFLLTLIILLIKKLVAEKAVFIKKNLLYFPLLTAAFFSFKWFRFIPVGLFLNLIIFVKIVQSEKMNAVYTRLFSLIVFILALTLLFKPPAFFRFNPPVRQLKIIKKLKLPTNVFTSFDLTGYFLFAGDDKAFVDLSDDLFDESEIINLYTYVTPLPETAVNNLLTDNHIDTALVHRDTGAVAYTLINQKDRWGLVYFDDNGYLFVRKSAVTADFAKKNFLEHIDLSRPLGFDPQNASQAAEELENFIKKYPDSLMATGQLASIYRIQKKYSLAEKTLRKIPQSRWNYVVYTEMGRLKAAQGLCVASEENYLRALQDRAEQNLSRAVLDLAVLYAGCFQDYEKARHFFSRYNSFPISSSEREFLRQLTNQFKIKLE